MVKIAIIGAGALASNLLEKKLITEFDLYTSDGCGTLMSVSAKSLSTLCEDRYDEIYIAVGVYHEILPQLTGIGKSKTQYFWMDLYRNKIQPINDLYGDFDSDNLIDVDSSQGLTVIYDMRIAPPTFDFLIFLADAEMERIRRKLKFIKLILAPGDDGGWPRGFWTKIPAQEKNIRLINIIYPITQQLNCKVYINQTLTRTDAGVLWDKSENKYPEKHDFTFPGSPTFLMHSIISRLSKGETHKVLKEVDDVYVNKMKQWAEERDIELSKVISISLRESLIESTRNSNLKAWVEFAKYAINRGYHVVFVRDTEKCFVIHDALDGYHTFEAASINLDYRRALYDNCFANMMVNNGVGMLTYFAKKPNYAIFKMVEESAGSSTLEFIKKIGLTYDAPYPGSPPWQRVCWKDDSFEVIKEEFEILEQIINEKK